MTDDWARAEAERLIEWTGSTIPKGDAIAEATERLRAAHAKGLREVREWVSLQEVAFVNQRDITPKEHLSYLGLVTHLRALESVSDEIDRRLEGGE